MFVERRNKNYEAFLLSEIILQDAMFWEALPNTFLFLILQMYFFYWYWKR